MYQVLLFKFRRHLCKGSMHSANFESRNLQYLQVIFTCQTLVKHKYTDNVMDIVFFTVCKIYFLLVFILFEHDEAQTSTRPNFESRNL